MNEWASKLITTWSYMTNLVTILIVLSLKLLGMKSYYKRVKIQSVFSKRMKMFHFLKKNNILFL